MKILTVDYSFTESLADKESCKKASTIQRGVKVDLKESKALTRKILQRWADATDFKSKSGKKREAEYSFQQATYCRRLLIYSLDKVELESEVREEESLKSEQSILDKV